jgi:hypothetical protein
MSAHGTKLPSRNVRAVVAIEGKADIKRMAKVEMHARDKARCGTEYASNIR